MFVARNPEKTDYRDRNREAQAWAIRPGDGGDIDIHNLTVQEARHVLP
jgi:hypothetical protein